MPAWGKRIMENLLLEQVDYKIEETGFGVWRRYMYSTGLSYHEFVSHSRVLGMPLVHYTFGRCPETGRRRIARGFIAVGRIACGVIAIGQASVGIVAIGQLALGLLFGLGQLSTGIAAVGQAAIAVYFGLGQLATGYIAIGQIAFGKYVLGQIGFGEFVYSMKRRDVEAVEFFKMLPILKNFFG